MGMKLTIRHTLRFTYSRPVSFHSTFLHLKPRTDERQVLRKFVVRFDPHPIKVSDGIDHEGNEGIRAWFEGTYDFLSVNAFSEVETTALSFCDADLVLPTIRLPNPYNDEQRSAFESLLRRQSQSSEDVGAFVDDIVEQTNGEVGPFLLELNRRLTQDFNHVIRPQGDPLPPGETFAQKKGACRDLAVLFIEGCRIVGLAARYTSGYTLDVLPGTKRELHAWPEVYVPEIGWCGFDPTSGFVVRDRHVAIVSGAESQATAAVSGTFGGGGVQSTLWFDISIHSI